MARNPKSAEQSSKPALPARVEQLLDGLVTGPMTAEAVQDTSNERWAPSWVSTWDIPPDRPDPRRPAASATARGARRY